MHTESSLEIDVQTVKALLDDGEDFLFLDCREPHEYDLCQIDGATLIPMGQIPGQLGSLEPHRQKRVVVLCHHGIRSLTAAGWLRQQGFERAQSMTGGIDAWSNLIDSSVPKY